MYIMYVKYCIQMNMHCMNYNHRVTIEMTSLSKETYTVRHPEKIFPSCEVFRGVDAYLNVWMNGLCLILQNHHPNNPTLTSTSLETSQEKNIFLRATFK